jgi:hypothetical protein
VLAGVTRNQFRSDLDIECQILVRGLTLLWPVSCPTDRRPPSRSPRPAAAFGGSQGFVIRVWSLPVGRQAYVVIVTLLAFESKRRPAVGRVARSGDQPHLGSGRFGVADEFIVE